MTTITHGGGEIPAEIDERIALKKKLMLGVLVGWVFFGFCFGILYANQVIIRDWDQSAALPAPPQGDILFAYVPNNIILNFFGGAIIWFAGMVILGILSWHTWRTRRRHSHIVPH